MTTCLGSNTTRSNWERIERYAVPSQMVTVKTLYQKQLGKN